MPSEPLADARAADWFVQADGDVWTKILLGPPGYAAYVRIQFADQDERPSVAVPTMPAVVDLLIANGGPFARGFVGLWEGYGGHVPAGPRFDVFEETSDQLPVRTYVLLTTPLDELFRPGVVWPDESSVFVEPHLVWPADRTWFIAADVDPQWFTVGASEDMASKLLANHSFDAELIPYGMRTARGDDW